MPWAEPCFPIVEGSVSGFGAWSIPLQGSQVMIFFEGKNINAPRYFATMPGIPEERPSNTTGFSDPSDKYPTTERLGEPDVHRLARGVSDGTLVVTKNNNRDLGVPEACSGTWDEPKSPFAAKYPQNYVIATHGGITVELDSTPGNTRLHLYHPSNSFIEIDNDGVMVIKNNAERYEIILSDNNIHVKRDRSLTTDNNYKRLTKEDECIDIKGNRTTNVDADVDETIGGDETREITGDKNITIHGGGDCKIDGVLNLEVDGLITVNGNGNILINSGNIEITGGTIQAGSQDTMYKLMDERTILVYNIHTHGSDHSVPNELLTVGSETTTNLEAS